MNVMRRGALVITNDYFRYFGNATMRWNLDKNRTFLNILEIMLSFMDFKL